MSTRIHLSTFDWNELHELFGSRDMTLSGEIREQLLDMEDLGQLDAKDVRVACQALEHAIQVGVLTRSGMQEGNGHVQLAEMLARVNQQHRNIEPEYKYFAVESCGQLYRNHFADPAKSLLDHLINGRPLFGSRISPRLLNRYGYLRRDEVLPLAEAFASFAQHRADESPAAEIADDYAHALTKAGRAGLDVWMSIG